MTAYGFILGIIPFYVLLVFFYFFAYLLLLLLYFFGSSFWIGVSSLKGWRLTIFCVFTKQFIQQLP